MSVADKIAECVFAFLAIGVAMWLEDFSVREVVAIGLIASAVIAIGERRG